MVSGLSNGGAPVAHKKVSDIDVLRGVLALQAEGERVTTRALAKEIGITGSAVHKRLVRMEEEGLVALMPEVGFRILPRAIDAVAATWSGKVEVQVDLTPGLPPSLSSS
jgi:DNA-binding Lrp family transcriptional regulator